MKNVAVLLFINSLILLVFIEAYNLYRPVYYNDRSLPNRTAGHRIRDNGQNIPLTPPSLSLLLHRCDILGPVKHPRSLVGSPRRSSYHLESFIQHRYAKAILWSINSLIVVLLRVKSKTFIPYTPLLITPNQINVRLPRSPFLTYYLSQPIRSPDHS